MSGFHYDLNESHLRFHQHLGNSETNEISPLRAGTTEFDTGKNKDVLDLPVNAHVRRGTTAPMQYTEVQRSSPGITLQMAKIWDGTPPPWSNSVSAGPPRSPGGSTRGCLCFSDQGTCPPGSPCAAQHLNAAFLRMEIHLVLPQLFFFLSFMKMGMELSFFLTLDPHLNTRREALKFDSESTDENELWMV